MNREKHIQIHLNTKSLHMGGTYKTDETKCKGNKLRQNTMNTNYM